MPGHSKQTIVAAELYDPVLRPGLVEMAAVTVDVSALTTREIDAQGYIKPGVVLKQNGTLVGVGEAAFGIVVEPKKIPTADDNEAATLTAATDFRLPVAVYGIVNRAVVEDNLGGALTADELAGLKGAGCRLQVAE
ncbi:MAG: hypothetical protein LC798_13500 [Chloroflexi bacterium]|nr:hypothetical protein [Chloroflexota bacterium]